MRRNLVLGLLLFVSPCAFADSVDVLTGTNHSQGFTYNYSFTIDTTLFTFTNVITGTLDTGVQAILNGTFLTVNKHVGCDPCTITFSNDIFEHTTSETQIMWEWGPIVDPLTGAQKWELISSASGAYILGPSVKSSATGLFPLVATSEPSASVVTPEPSALVLLGCGLVFLLRRTKLASSR